MSKAKNQSKRSACRHQTAAHTTGTTGRNGGSKVPLLSKREPETPERRQCAQEAACREETQRAGWVSRSQFWMHEEDRQLVRELSAWLAGQGMRPTDSMVIRAVLRLAKTGKRFARSLLAGSKAGRADQARLRLPTVYVDSSLIRLHIPQHGILLYCPDAVSPRSAPLLILPSYFLSTISVVQAWWRDATSRPG